MKRFGKPRGAGKSRGILLSDMAEYFTENACDRRRAMACGAPASSTIFIMLPKLAWEAMEAARAKKFLIWLCGKARLRSSTAV